MRKLTQCRWFDCSEICCTVSKDVKILCFVNAGRVTNIFFKYSTFYFPFFPVN